ncbi:hypothetical protein CsSME_00005202 [Camellia sinensis var. sinensis]
MYVQYLEDRVESSWESVEIIESVKKNFIEKMMAVMAVFTRARLRAATLARDVFGLCTNGLMALIPSLVNVYVQELVWMLQDFLIDSQEIGNLIVGMKSAVIVEKGIVAKFHVDAYTLPTCKFNENEFCFLRCHHTNKTIHIQNGMAQV